VAFIHQAWLLMIYLVSLVLSTFWTQDIFDHLMEVKIKKSGQKVNFKPMKGKDIAVDLISRTVVITVFVVSSQIVCLCLSKPLSALLEIFTQSLLTAFYCFEYKTAAAGVDTPTGLHLFEKQWIY